MILKKYLPEVVFIRLLLIVLLVLYHSFAPYCGGWEPLPNQEMIPAYWWIGKAAYSFMLPAFVFISGYVYGFQVRTKGVQILTFKKTVYGKFKRLIIPSIVFSLLYLLVLGDITQPITTTLYGLINGVGHMWFLPMLFWCFVCVFIIEKLKLKTSLVLPLLVFAAVFSFLPLPLRLDNSMFYMLFFYLGYLIQKNAWPLDKYYTTKNSAVILGLFLLSFVYFTILINGRALSIASGGNLLIKKISLYSCKNVLILLYSTLGIMLALFVTNCLLKRGKLHLTPFTVQLSGYCFGVYLFQQFVLKLLYDKTQILERFGSVALPWIGFAIALLVSLIFTSLLLRTKIGRLLIG